MVTSQLGPSQSVTGHPVTGHWRWITRHRLPSPGMSQIIQSLVTGHQSTYQTPVSGIHAVSTEHRTSNQSILGSEHAFVNEHQNSTPTTKRVLLPLEPDFSNMSNPSIVIEPPNINWRSDNRQVSQSRRISRRDQTKRKHKSRKRRRHRPSSSSSSSRSSCSDSLKCSRKSKRSKQSHKRSRRSTSSSSSSSPYHSVNDYSRYKRSRQTPQVAEAPSMLQPAETTNVTPLPQLENLAQHSAKDTGSVSDQEIWSFDSHKWGI